MEITQNRYRNFILYILFSYIFLLPWLRTGNAHFPSTIQFAIFGLILGILSALIWLGYSFGSFRFSRNAIWIPFSLILISQIISGLVNGTFGHALFGAYTFQSDGILYTVLQILLLFALFSLNLNKREKGTLIGLLLVQYSIINWQIILEFLRSNNDPTFRAKTVLVNPDYYLSYATLLGPLMIAFLIKHIRPFKWHALLGSITGCILAFFGLYYSLPTSVRNLTFSEAVQTAQAQTQQLEKQIAEVVIPKARAATSDFFNTSANNERILLWKMGWQFGLDHPIIGVGPGNFRNAFYQTLPEQPSWDYSQMPDFPHSEIIQVFALGGILGLLTYLYFWFNVFKFSFKNRKKSNPGYQPYYIASTISLILYFVFNQALFTSVIPGIILVIILYLVFCVNTEIVNTTYSATISKTNKRTVNIKPEKEELAEWLRWAYVGLAVVSVAITITSVKLLKAETHAEKGRIATTNKLVGEGAQEYQNAYKSFPWIEEYYRLAAANNYYLYAALRAQNGDPAQYVKVGQDAIKESDKALKMNKENPQHYALKGAITYVVALPNSPEEEEGMRLTDEAIKRSPYDWNSYAPFLQALQLNGDKQITERQSHLLLDNAPSNIIETVKHRVDNYQL